MASDQRVTRRGSVLVAEFCQAIFHLLGSLFWLAVISEKKGHPLGVGQV